MQDLPKTQNKTSITSRRCHHYFAENDDYVMDFETLNANLLS